MKAYLLISSGNRTYYVLVVSVGLLMWGSSCVVADDITLTHVLNAWRNREQHVKSFRFQWEQKDFQAKDSVTLPPERKYEGLKFPPKDTTYRMEQACEMNRRMMRYSFSGESLQFYNGGELEHREYVSASDGEISKAFWPIPNKLRAYPKGLIFDQKYCSDADSLEVKPLLWIYRALDPQFAFSEKTLQFSSKTEIIGGKTCAIVKFVKGEKEQSIWTDPERDFVPLRFMISSTVTGEVSTQCDIAYERDPTHGWTPKSWRIVQPATGDLSKSMVARVTKYLINIEIPKSRFQIEFPVATVVIDMRNKSERYAVGADGSKQIPPDAKRN